MAGYSGAPLAKKLGIKERDRVGVLGDPGLFASLLAPLPDGVDLVRNPRAACDVFVAFAPDRRRLESRLERVTALMPANTAVWICWPKRGSGRETDLTEDAIRDIALPRRLVDIKVCAVDEIWSGLKLVVRKEHRTSWPG